MRAFEKLPPEFQNPKVKQYYDILQKKRASVFLKRAFDIFIALILLLFLLLPIAILAILVKCDSKGPAMFRQERVTKYGKKFRIYKFRTMVVNAESLGTLVTTDSEFTLPAHGYHIIFSVGDCFGDCDEIEFVEDEK